MGNNQIKISDLQQLNAEQMNRSEVLEISQEEDSKLKSKKSTLSRIGAWLSTIFNFNNLNTNDKSIIGAINEKITSEVACYGAPAHNSVYRGKWLGTAPTEEQLDAIENGSFDDLFIGDFWSNDPDNPNEIRWRIAGFNYYQNTGYSYDDGVVLRNHAVIIPDSAIVLDSGSAIESSSGVSNNGGYKYTKLRGYEGTSDYIHSNNKTKVGNIVTLHNLSHIPSYVVCLRSGITVYDSGGVSHGDAEIAFDIIEYGEDPDNPGKGYVKYNDKNFSVIQARSDIFPSQWDSNHFQDYTVVCMYKYYTGTGGLLTAKQIIFDKFGEEHVMKHKIPLTVTKKASYNPYLYDLTYQSEWTEVTIETPTSEMIFGNAPCSSFGEHELDEYSRQMSRVQPTYITNADATDVDKSYSIPDTTRKPLNSIYCPHIEMYQLPLFVYDPALIHNRYGYWLRNIYTYDLVYMGNGYMNFSSQHHYTCLVDGYGRQWGYDYNNYYHTGTRPFFCLAKYNTPQPAEEDNV